MAFKNRKHNYPLYETTHFDNIRTMVENAAQRHAEKPALTFKRSPSDKTAQSLTFAQCREYVRSLATELTAMGMTHKTVAIIGEVSPEWVFAYFAAMSMGAITVPIDKELPAADMASILNTAECEFAFCSTVIEKKLPEVLAVTPKLTCVIAMGDAFGEYESIASLRQKGDKRVESGDNSYLDYEIDNDALASIVFTSGTTGKGKGVMLSQKNICSDMEQGMYNFQITYKTMCVLPPHHTFGSTVNLVGHFAQGCEIYLSSGIRYIMKELNEFKPTHLILVPLFIETFYKRIMVSAEKSGKLPMLKKLIKISNALRKVGIDARKTLFKSVTKNFGGELEMIICGGAALNQSIIDFFEDIGITVLN